MKPDRIPDPTGTGKMVEDFWGPSKRVLGDMKFLESLITFDKDNISPVIMKKIFEKILPDENFDPEKIKYASTAAEGKEFNLKMLFVLYHCTKVLSLTSINYPLYPIFIFI